MEKRKIMIVDDEETLATFLAKVLKDDNLATETDVELTGEDALVAIPEFMPDLVMLDIKLPKKSGTEVLKNIKEFNSNIQVIMMTGYASIDSAVASLREGAYDYINKPFETSQVKILVKNALERRNLLIERETLISDLSEVNEKLADANILLKEKKALVDKALENRIEQLSKLNKISNSINAEIDIEKLIKQIPGSIINLFNALGSFILFLVDDKSNLIIKGCAGNSPFSPGTKISTKIIPFDVAVTKKSIAQATKVKIGKKEVGPIVCSSLRSGGQNIGALCVLSTEEMDKDSLQLLNTLATTASIALENASLFDNLKRSSLESILSMLRIEGLKDSAIKEHSQRVSELSETLAKSMGLSKEDVRNIKYASLIHDIGRVVLEKQPSDYKPILEKTLDIMGHVKFLKNSLDILKFSLNDFSKKGEKIPITSRIFSVVNNFDESAREGINIGDVIKKLEKEKKFDPVVVDNFKKILQSKVE